MEFTASVWLWFSSTITSTLWPASGGGVLLVGAGVDELPDVVGAALVAGADVAGAVEVGAGVLDGAVGEAEEDVEIGAVVITSRGGWLAVFSFDAQDHRVALVVLVTRVSEPEAATAPVTSASA
jgi:hypothetical protein